jgi:flagellar motility protein MotE (MotC chaperone)
MKKPSALLLISLCFVASAGLRIWSSNGQISVQLGEWAQAAQSQEEASMALAQCPPVMEPREMLLAFKERAEQLDALELRLANREQVLRVAKIRIEDQLKELEEAEKSLSATIAQADGAAENDIARLTSVYENMKPQAAAQIFQTMDVKFASNFLARMRPDAAANILSNLEPDAAYSISVMMASRNADVPKE